MNDLVNFYFEKQGYWYEGLEYGNNTQLNPFFYGVTLEHKPKWFTYQSDAISANTNIDKDYFENFHKYRVEWEPPEDDETGGYLYWYLDDKFLYSIQSGVLGLTNTEIPSEPMYLLMNTAVASSWGFPKPCPEGCDCSCYECGNSDCTCGLPEGFCDNFPAYFEIDYVRVFQAVNESKHILGCSTEKRPTARFIQGHKEDYMSKFDGQKEPLLAVQRGGAYCMNSSDCGNNGECSNNKCTCYDEFTGPGCLSPDGFDDNAPPPEKIEFSQMVISPSMISLVASFLMAFIMFVGLAVLKKRKQAIANYDQLVDTSSHTGNGRLMGVGTTRTGDQVPPNGSYGQRSYQKQDSNAPYNPMGGVNNDQKTVTYCMIDGRLLDDQNNAK